MKNFLLLLVMLVMISTLQAQVPQKFSYQAVARNASSELLVGQNLTVQIGILQDNELVWQEDHAVTTNEFGVFSLQIGGEDALNGSGSAGSFAEIPWGTGFYEINVQLDDGNGFVNLGKSELLSTPYALYAANGPSGPQGEPGEQGPQGEAGPPGDPASDDQDIAFDGVNLSIDNGSTVDLSSLSDGVEDADADVTNELQSLSFSNGLLSLSMDPDPQTINLDSRAQSATGWRVNEGLVETAYPIDIWTKDGQVEEPLFEVRNDLGNPVFAVFNDGVMVYVDEDKVGEKGGFAVGGYSQATQDVTQEYFRITPDSVRVWVPDEVYSSKGIKGGFAVGGYNKKTKAETSNYIEISRTNTNIYFDTVTTKGIKGGFAVGGYNSSKADLPSKQVMSIRPDNYLIGQEAGENISTGKNNSFLGYQAGMNNTTGYDNIFLGKHAGFSNYSARENIFIGNESGYNIESGYGNVLVGNGTGHENLKGYYNTFVGHESGHNNDSHYNTGLGYQAGFNNTDGSRNIFMGFRAGYGYPSSGGGVTGNDNIFIGQNAGYDNTSGSDNLFLGSNAGSNNTYGNNNVFIGKGSGISNTSGNSNVFIGESAGESNLSGYNNVMIGYQAGINSVGDGSAWNNTFNVFLGYQAGYNNESGGAQVSIGHQAGYSNTDANYLVAIGNTAGYFTTGDDNVFVGGEAGHYVSDGENNTYIGHIAGRGANGNNNTYLGRGAGWFGRGDENTFVGSNAGYGSYDIKYHNTFVGYNSGLDVSTGSYNTFLGHRSGELLTSGTNNTFIGYHAGSSLTTGYGNVFLGYTAGESETGNNKLYIENGAATLPLIYGDFVLRTLDVNGRLKVYGDIIPDNVSTSYDLGNSVAGEVWDEVVAYDFITYSDERTKKNINDLSYGLSEIMQLRPVQFQYQEKFNPSNKTKYGLIAQEVEAVIPDVVVNEDIDLDPETGELIVTPTEYKLMNYVELVPVLINAIQEQQKQIESLELRIEELENQ